MTPGEYVNKYKPIYEEVKATLIAKGHVKFVDDAESMYAEFKKEEGFVTCEFSTKGEDLDHKMKFLTLMGMIDPTSIGYWTVHWCDTCEGHHPDHPFHCQIVRLRE